MIKNLKIEYVWKLLQLSRIIDILDTIQVDREITNWLKEERQIGSHPFNQGRERNVSYPL